MMRKQIGTKPSSVVSIIIGSKTNKQKQIFKIILYAFQYFFPFIYFLINLYSKCQQNKGTEIYSCKYSLRTRGREIVSINNTLIFYILFNCLNSTKDFFGSIENYKYDTICLKNHLIISRIFFDIFHIFVLSPVEIQTQQTLTQPSEHNQETPVSFRDTFSLFLTFRDTSYM